MTYDGVKLVYLTNRKHDVFKKHLSDLRLLIFIFLLFRVVSQITYLYRALKINRTQAVNEFELGHIVVIQLHREL